MAKYYILTDYLVPVFYKGASFGPIRNSSIRGKRIRYRKDGIKFPRNVTLIKFSDKYDLKVVYYEFDIGHFLIKAPSRCEAYFLAYLIRGFFGIFLGWIPYDSSNYYFLQEVNKIPKPTWTESDLLKELKQINYGDDLLLILHLSGGHIIDEESIKNLKKFINATINNSMLIESINNLLESRFLFNGYMVDSYYHIHYKHDRRDTSELELEKRYYENRYIYELAFLSAFKGIEGYFGVNSIKKSKVKSMFKKVKHRDVKPETVYTRHHEIFSGSNEKITYEEIIIHFLLTRNVIAAHSNKKPPSHLKFSEDNIFEIQRFLSELIIKAIDINKK